MSKSTSPVEHLLGSLLIRREDGSVGPAYSPDRRQDTSSADETMTVSRPTLTDAPIEHGTCDTHKQVVPTEDVSFPILRADRTGPVNTHPSNHRISASSTDHLDLESIEDFERRNPFRPNSEPKHSAAVRAHSDPVGKFHQLCQNLDFTHEFTFCEPIPGHYTGKVRFGLHAVECLMGFITKKQAQLEICKLALPVLERLAAGYTKKPNSDEPKDEGVAEASDRIDSAILNSESWVVKLQNWSQRQRGLVMLKYEELCSDTVPPQYSCIVRFAGSPSAPFGVNWAIFGVNQNVFGGHRTTYPSKVEAKKAAAREAVTWLRSQGKMALPPDPHPPNQTTTPPNKRRKITNESSQGSEISSLCRDNPLPPLRSTGPNLEGAGSVAARARQLCNLLGLSSPRFEIESSQGNFVTMAAYFDERDVKAEPTLAGAVGRAKQVRGNKKAREVCWRAILRVLEGIRRSKMG